MAYTTIDKPSDYFETKLYTGNGSSSHAITGVGFQPDWIWIKRRDTGAWHYLFDSIRGANKTLYSNLNAAETTDTNNLQSFDSDGFTVGTQADMNASGGTFASWNWLASNTTASNTDGSITSTVSANTTSGFSIVSYTGTGSNATVGHGLGVAPKMVIIKNRSDSYDWIIYNQNIGNTGFLRLNTTAAYDTGINMFQNTDSTSSVFSISSHGAVNTSGNNFIAYCFAEKKGFSKFSSYVGNGSSDGSYIHLGFKPAFLMLKNTSSTGNWVMYDDKRSEVPDANVNRRIVYANTSADYEIPSGSRTIDTLSNGFKLRGTAGDTNTSGNSYIYMAFASNPFVTSTGIPTTAR